jgi:hypothetical protein
MVDGLRCNAGDAGELNASRKTTIIVLTMSLVIPPVGLMIGKAPGCSHVFFEDASDWERR